MELLKQSITVTLQFGPFLDITDGVTEETGLTPGIEISKAGGAFAARNSATAVTHDAEGWYLVELNTTDTATLGRLVVKAQDAANHLPVWRTFQIVPANVYDSLVGGSDLLDVSLSEVATAAANKLADHTLRRSFASAVDSSDGDAKSFRSLLGAVAKLVNRIAVSGSTLTVYEDDDTTALGTQALTTNAALDPVSEIDTT